MINYIVGNIRIPLVRLQLLVELTYLYDETPLTYSALTDEKGLPLMDVLTFSQPIGGKQYKLRIMTEGGKSFIEKGQKLFFSSQVDASREVKQ